MPRPHELRGREKDKHGLRKRCAWWCTCGEWSVWGASRATAEVSHKAHCVEAETRLASGKETVNETNHMVG